MSTIRVTPDQLRTLHSKCSGAASDVEGVLSTVQSAIASTDWESPASARFQGDWDSRYVPALKDLSRALEELGSAANTMATNYDQTEAAYKGAG